MARRLRCCVLTYSSVVSDDESRTRCLGPLLRGIACFRSPRSRRRLSSPCCRLHHPLAVTVTHSLPHDGAAHNVARRAAADGVGPFWTRAARRRRDSTETFSDNGNSVPSRPAAWSAVQLVWARGRCRHLRRSIGPWRWRRVRSRRRPACEAAMRPCSQSACVCVHSRARDCSLSRIRMGTVILCGLHRSRFQTPLGDGASKKRLRSRRIS